MSEHPHPVSMSVMECINVHLTEITELLKVVVEHLDSIDKKTKEQKV